MILICLVLSVFGQIVKHLLKFFIIAAVAEDVSAVVSPESENPSGLLILLFVIVILIDNSVVIRFITVFGISKRCIINFFTFASDSLIFIGNLRTVRYRFRIVT